MLEPDKLLDAVVEYSKDRFKRGQVSLYKVDLRNYIRKVDPGAETTNLDSVINELDARGWLLINSNTEIEFDPASFQ